MTDAPTAQPSQPISDRDRAGRLVTLLNAYGAAKCGDEWWPSAAEAWLGAEDATELEDLLAWVDTPPPARPAPGQAVAAQHTVVHILTLDPDEATAHAHIDEVLSSAFLDWGYVTAFDPETGEAMPGPDGLQTPMLVSAVTPTTPGSLTGS